MKILKIVVLILFVSLNAFAASQQTSSTTAASIIDNAEIILNDTDNKMWTAGELLQWLNEGMIDIVSRSHCLEATEDINLVANTIEYTITSTYLTVKAVLYVDASSTYLGLKKGAPYNIGNIPDDWNTAAENIPVFWYDWAGKIGIYPTLSSVTTETIKLYLITRPTAIVSSANVTTPAIYDTALTFYIVAQAYKKDKTHSKYLQTMGLYEAEMNRLRQDLNEIPVKPLEN